METVPKITPINCNGLSHTNHRPGIIISLVSGHFYLKKKKKKKKKRKQCQLYYKHQSTMIVKVPQSLKWQVSACREISLACTTSLCFSMNIVNL